MQWLLQHELVGVSWLPKRITKTGEPVNAKGLQGKERHPGEQKNKLHWLSHKAERNDERRSASWRVQFAETDHKPSGSCHRDGDGTHPLPGYVAGCKRGAAFSKPKQTSDTQPAPIPMR